MTFEHLSIGIIPDFIMRPFLNMIFKVLNGQFKSFETIIAAEAKKALENCKGLIPNHVDIPNSPFAVSLSVPQLP